MKKIAFLFAVISMTIFCSSCDEQNYDFEANMAPKSIVNYDVIYDTAMVAVDNNEYECTVYRIQQYGEEVDTTTFTQKIKCEFSGVPSWEREVKDFEFAHTESYLNEVGGGETRYDNNWTVGVREYTYNSKNSNIAKEENTMPYSGKVNYAVFDNGEARFEFVITPEVSDIETNVTVNGNEALLVNTIEVLFGGFTTELSDSIRLNKVAEPEPIVVPVEPVVETGNVKVAYQTVARSADRKGYVYTLSIHYNEGSVMPVAISSETLEVIATGEKEENGDSRYNGGVFVSQTLINCIATDQAGGMVWASSADKRIDAYGFDEAVMSNWDSTSKGRSVKTTRFNLSIENGILTVVDTVSGKTIGSWK